MPGYLFVQVDHDRQSIASIRAVHGVAELVGINGAPAAISERDIANLRKIEAEVNAAHANPEPTYAQGEEVKVKSGMWQGHVGRFMAESPEGRIRLLFDGKFIKGPQEFEAEQVEKAA
jgi:transcription antitermination factor NusG